MVPMCLTSSLSCIPNTIQRKALQTRTLKMENYEKCSPLCLQNREDCAPSRIANRKERGASAKRAQADLRKGLVSGSSQEPSALEKPAALFSFGNEEPENLFKSSVPQNADPSNVGRSLLEGNRDHLLTQAKSELMREEHQVEPLNNCISELQQQIYAQKVGITRRATRIH